MIFVVVRCSAMSAKLVTKASQSFSIKITEAVPIDVSSIKQAPKKNNKTLIDLTKQKHVITSHVNSCKPGKASTTRAIPTATVLQQSGLAKAPRNIKLLNNSTTNNTDRSISVNVVRPTSVVEELQQADVTHNTVLRESRASEELGSSHGSQTSTGHDLPWKSSIGSSLHWAAGAIQEYQSQQAQQGSTHPSHGNKNRAKVQHKQKQLTNRRNKNMLQQQASPLGLQKYTATVEGCADKSVDTSNADKSHSQVEMNVQGVTSLSGASQITSDAGVIDMPSWDESPCPTGTEPTQLVTNNSNIINIQYDRTSPIVPASPSSSAAADAVSNSDISKATESGNYLVQIKYPLTGSTTAPTTITAIHMDFENLLGVFKETENVRYEHFAQIWREMRMPYIFSGKQTDKECREFTEECLQVALGFYLASHAFQTRVGGLYLLYAVYNKQLFEPRVKIRVNLSQWKQILEFQQDACSKEHYDVDYIFWWLTEKKAFHFVLESTAPQLRTRGRDAPQELTSWSQLQEDKPEAPSQVPGLLSGSIEDISSIHEHYHQMKCGLSGPLATTPSLSLSVIQTDLVQYITKTVTNFEDWKKNKAGKKKREGRRRKDSGATTTSESEVDSENEWITDSSDSPTKKHKKAKTSKSVGSVRAEIKARAFSNVGASTRSRRHRHVRDLSHISSPVNPGKKSVRTEDLEAAAQPSEQREEAEASREGIILSMPRLIVGIEEDQPNIGHGGHRGEEVRVPSRGRRRRGCGGQVTKVKDRTQQRGPYRVADDDIETAPPSRGRGKRRGRGRTRKS